MISCSWEENTSRSHRGTLGLLWAPKRDKSKGFNNRGKKGLYNLLMQSFRHQWIRSEHLVFNIYWSICWSVCFSQALFTSFVLQYNLSLMLTQVLVALFQSRWMLERLYVLEYVFQHSVYLHKTQNPRLLLAGPLRLRPRHPLLSQHMQKSPLCCSSSSLPSFPPARGQFPPAAGTLTAATAAVVNLRQSRLHYLKKKKKRNFTSKQGKKYWRKNKMALSCQETALPAQTGRSPSQVTHFYYNSKRSDKTVIAFIQRRSAADHQGALAWIQGRCHQSCQDTYPCGLYRFVGCHNCQHKSFESNWLFHNTINGQSILLDWVDFSGELIRWDKNPIRVQLSSRRPSPPRREVANWSGKCWYGQVLHILYIKHGSRPQR